MASHKYSFLRVFSKRRSNVYFSGDGFGPLHDFLKQMFDNPSIYHDAACICALVLWAEFRGIKFITLYKN